MANTMEATVMPETFWKIQREISDLLAKAVLTERDLEKVEVLRDALCPWR